MGKYVILKSDALEFDSRTDDNHIFIHTAMRDTEYSLAVNVQSNVQISRLYYCIKTFDLHSDALPGTIKKWLLYWLEKDYGQYSFEDEEKGMRLGVHYKDGWVEQTELLPAEPELPVPLQKEWKPIDFQNNEFARKLVQLIKSNMADSSSFLVAAGILWGPKEETDWTFGFYPARGIHDIHQNDNSADGALFFYDPDHSQVIGIFTAFHRVEES